jgi:hypothetical protein
VPDSEKPLAVQADKPILQRGSTIATLVAAADSPERYLWGGWLVRLGLIWIIVGPLVALRALSGLETRSFASTLPWVIAGVAMSLLGSVALLVGRPLKAWDVETTLQRDGRAPVLYLRPFFEDKGAPVGVGLENVFATSDEEGIEKMLDSIGPVVAIGNPADARIWRGAARLYLSGRWARVNMAGPGGWVDWQTQVTNFMSRAALTVVIVAVDAKGTLSEGLRWEIDTACRLVAPERLLLLFPAPGDWRAFVAVRASIDDTARFGGLEDVAELAFDATGAARVLAHHLPPDTAPVVDSDFASAGPGTTPSELPVYLAAKQVKPSSRWQHWRDRATRKM